MWLIVIIFLWRTVHRAKRIAAIHASHLFSYIFYFYYPHSSMITVKYKRQHCTCTFYYAKTRWLATEMTVILASLATEKIDLVVVLPSLDFQLWYLFGRCMISVLSKSGRTIKCSSDSAKQQASIAGGEHLELLKNRLLICWIPYIIISRVNNTFSWPLASFDIDVVFFLLCFNMLFVTCTCACGYYVVLFVELGHFLNCT